MKVLVGMSGGIDSAVTALLLKEKGFDVSGVTMTVWKNDGRFTVSEGNKACFSPDKHKDIEKIGEICEKLGIKNTVIDISDLYESVVLSDFRNEYLNGRTPNPCVWCNQKIKFGAMVQAAREHGIDFDVFATGHYARIVRTEEGRYAVKRAEDKTKDQSYFLYRLSQNQLASTLFPLGDMLKSEVRRIDVENGFHPEGHPESQDFYSGHYSDLLDVEACKGNIVDTDGKILGTHSGMWNYTIGQRKGLGISGPRPLYVAELDPGTNTVVVGYEESMIHTSVKASNIVWQAVQEIDRPIHAAAKIRSTGVPVPCTVYIDCKDRLCAEFDSPVRAATRGQSLVVYKNDTVMCGGIICDVG